MCSVPTKCSGRKRDVNKIPSFKKKPPISKANGSQSLPLPELPLPKEFPPVAALFDCWTTVAQETKMVIGSCYWTSFLCRKHLDHYKSHQCDPWPALGCPCTGGPQHYRCWVDGRGKQQGEKDTTYSAQSCLKERNGKNINKTRKAALKPVLSQSLLSQTIMQDRSQNKVSANQHVECFLKGHRLALVQLPTHHGRQKQPYKHTHTHTPVYLNDLLLQAALLFTT